MKTFKVTWYLGSVVHIESVIKEKHMKANSLDEVKWATILPKEEKSKFEDSFKYCIRVIHLIEGKKHSIDYGSYSRFVMVEEE